MAVTLDQIKDLRKMTGVSMMACKKALEEAESDMDKAIDILRKSGEAKSVDRAARDTKQGVVTIKTDGFKAAMLSLLCETDFVSRGEDFIKVAEDLVGKLFDGKIKETDTEFQEVKDYVLKAGENVKVGQMAVVNGENLGIYVHSNKKIGAIVSLKGGTPELAKDVAMHAAAMNPDCISPDEISSEKIAKEKEIWTEQLAKEGKPKEIIEKIMIGKEKKFREENALLKQQFVKDPEKTIEQFLSGAQIMEFKRFFI